MRAVLVAAQSLATTVVFLLALAAGVVVHLSAPAVRRIVATRVNQVLAKPFEGRIVIDRIGFIGAQGVTGVDAHVDDPDGVTVLRARGTSGRIGLRFLVRSLLAGDGIDIEIPEATVAEAEADLDADAAGVLRIAKAFKPRAALHDDGLPGPKVRVALPIVHVVHGAVHGQPSGAPPIDGEIDDADASLLVTPPNVRVDVRHARVVERSPLPSGNDARGDVEGRLTVPSGSGGALGLSGEFHGTVGSIDTRANATYDSGVLEAVLDVPAAAPDRMRALLPSWPLTAPLAVHAEGRGTLPELDVHVHGVLQSGSVDVTGPVVLVPLQAQLHVDVRAIDPHGMLASIPASDVTAAGAVTIVTAPGGAITAHANLDVASGRIGTVPTPPSHVTAELVRAAPPSTDVSARATVVIHEPGAPVEIAASLASSRGTLMLSYSGRVRAERLEDVPLLRALRRDVHGRAVASATGTLDLRTARIDAKVSAAVETITAGGVSVAAVHGEAHVSGPIVEPVAEIAIAGEEFSAPGLHLSTVQSRARFEITRGAFHDLDLRIDEAGEEMLVHAALVRFGSGEVQVDDAEIEGFGEPVQASVRASSGSLSIHLAAPAIDLERVTRFAHWTRVQGRVRLDVEATIDHGRTDGRATVDVSHGAVATLHDIDGRIGATLHGREITGEASLRVADIGTLAVKSTALQLGGRALDPQAWRRAWGAIDADVHVDLAKLVGTLPAGLLPLTEVRGVVDVKTRFERDSAIDMTPEINVSAQTTGLALFGRRASGTWSFQGIDPAVQLIVDGDTGATTFTAQIRDTVGDLATANGSSNAVPWSTLLLGDAPLAPALEAMPFDARVEIPARRLETLPKSLLFGPTGQLQGALTWHGAATRPTVDVAATLSDGIFDTRVFALPSDLEWKAHYDGASATTSVTDAVRGRQVLDARAAVTVRAIDLLAALHGAPVPWAASASGQLTELPIQGLTALDDRQVHGRATGTFVVERFHEDARARVALTFEGLRVGDIACRTANLDATVDGHAMHASAAIDHTDGTISIDARAGSHWGAAVAPALDASQPLTLSISAKAFRAALLMPMVSRVFSDLDGRIDGEASVTIDPGANTAHPSGALALRDGSFEMNELGGEFTGVGAKLTLTPDGVFRLADVRANSLNGTLTAAASGRLDGLALAGARVTMNVPRTTQLPIVFDGVQMGAMDGDLDATIVQVPGHKGLHVELDVPKLHVELPSAATRDVQTLGDLQGIRTGIVGADRTFVPIALDPPSDDDETGPPRAPIQITVKLGKEVQIKRAPGGAGQPDLAVSIEGDPVITIADHVRASGQIRLVRGTIGVGGKPFEIEKGTVAFVGDDPANPQVVLTAGWTAPDGTRVTADFVGPLKTGKVTLHANPAPPGGENGILALILFGSADQGANGNNANSATPAAGFAGSEATAPINKALGGVNGALERFGLGGGLTTKVDTSQTNPRPEVELQIARDISLEVAWVLGLPPPGMPDTTLVTFNWRFLRKWSLLTTVGNTGTSILDVVWQHRY